MAYQSKPADKDADDDVLDDELKCCLKTICDHFESEDEFVRMRNLRLWKKLKYYWNGFHRVWWSETAHDWRIFDDVSNTDDADFYDKPVNVFRAYLESIIAALSITVPPIKCTPDDADNPSDMSTAKAGDKITTLVYKHIDAPLQWIHALFIYCTEGLITAYNYTDTNESYGTYETPKYGQEDITGTEKYCSNCGGPIPESYEYDPRSDDEIIQGMEFCPTCEATLPPELKSITKSITKIVGTMKSPKSRQCVEVYGGLNVKIASYARKACETPYLRYAYECHWTKACEEFPQLWDSDSKSWRVSPGSVSAYDQYERWARLSPQYYGEYPQNIVTIRKMWLRPYSFNYISDETKRKKLLRLFPDGVKVSYVNDCYVESEGEKLDDHWTLAKNPLSDFVHYDPLGLLLTSIQEITNDLVSLVLQTIEHGIPQTFADQAVLNFEAYRKQEVSPGTIFPVQTKAGKSVSDSFYEIKTATLSQEVQPFAERVQQMGQFVSGALPAIFGAMESKTAAQDSMSKAQAMQRLQNAWKMLNYFWKDIFGKVIPAYIKDVKSDESYAVRDPQNRNNFINVVIRKSELEGKLGDIELEASDALPLTWAQQKDVIMQLLATSNPDIIAALTAPENAGMVAEAIGLDDFFIPGEDDRLKEFDEIAQLLASQPMPTGEMGMDGQPQMAPSVPIDPMLDNHQIASEIDRKWLVSEVGRQAKLDNAEGYQNVLLHYQAHVMQLQMMNAGQPQGNEQPTKGPNDQGQGARPIANPAGSNTGASNNVAPTIQ